MTDRFEVEWKVEDGYVNNGPQSSSVDPDEVLDLESDDEIIAFLGDRVQDDFGEKISYNIETKDEEFIKWVREAQEEAKKNDDE